MIVETVGGSYHLVCTENESIREDLTDAPQIGHHLSFIYIFIISIGWVMSIGRGRTCGHVHRELQESGLLGEGMIKWQDGRKQRNI